MLRLRGTLDRVALGRALGDLAERHGSLRTQVEVDERGEPRQARVAAREVARLPCCDLTGLPPSAARAEARRLAHAHVRRPFDMARGPLVRMALVKRVKRVKRVERGADGERPEEAHDLLLSVHHLIGDGWSVGIFFEELRALYEARVAGARADLPELPVEYDDFAAWQRERVASGAYDDSLAYWRDRLSGAPVAELPADRPRPASPSGRGERLPVVLDRDLAHRLRRLAAAEGATLYAALLAGFQLLLRRRTGEDDVVTGAVVAGRTRPEAERLIGFFANTLVLRTETAGARSFRGLVRRAAATVVEALRHQEVPFARVVEGLAGAASAGDTPLFRTMISMDARPGGRVGMGAADGEIEEVPTGTAKFDLALHLVERDAEVAGTLELSLDLFDRSTVLRLWRHYVELLAAAVAAPGRRLELLEGWSPAERQAVLFDWGQGPVPAPRVASRSLPDLVRDRARLQPDAVAVEQGDERLTYAGLLARADRLARALVRAGIRPEDRVAVLLDAPFGWPAAFLGVQAAGGVYLPLDPSQPAARLSALASEAGPRALLVRGPVPSLPELAGVPTLDLEAICAGERPGAAAGDERGARWRRPASPAGLAYVLYTSGSTGRPKGVAVSHGGLANLAAAQAARLGLSPSDRVFQFAPLVFDASVSELAASLVAGATLVLATRDERLPGEKLAQRLRERRVTCLKLPPSSLALLPAPSPTADRGADLPDLRRLAVAGEPCPPVLVERWSRGRLLFNVYGPTECTVTAAVGELAPGGPVTLGGPITGLRARVVDRDLLPLPTGVPGDLCVAGPGIARGYLARPAATAERFVPDPWSPEPGGRLYRTGDRVRWLTDGRLQYLGRLDRQVKVRGVRTEPGEVEAAFAGLPGVREAVVDAVRDAAGDMRLVCWVTPREDAGPEGPDLRQRMSEILPPYLVPSVVRVIEEVPRTPSGKVDRRRLQALLTPPAPAGRAPAAPETPTEERLAELFGELLGIESVGREDDFFELGGHSLTSVRLAARIRTAFGVALPLKRVFELRTVAALAADLPDLPVAAHPPSEDVPHRDPGQAAGPFPLSHAQERLWLLAELDPGAAAYNVAGAVRLRGRLRPAALAAGLTEIARRHQVLRATFADTEEGPVQRIGPAAPVPLPVIDLGGVASRADGEEERWSRCLARRPLDLARGPLFEAVLLRRGPEENLLLLTMHHVVSDGWSVGILVRELREIYGARLRGVPPDLPDLALQYPDLAAAERLALSERRLEELLAYWRGRLAAAPVLELPLDRPRPPVWSGRGAEIPLILDPGLSRAVRELAEREGSTLFMVLAAAFQALLGRFTGQPDVVVGFPVANRERPEAERLIGFFVNTLALRTDLAAEPRFRGMLRQVRSSVLEALDHQALPFQRLVNDLAPDRDTARPPLVQALVSLQNAAEVDMALPEVEGELVPAATGTAKFELTIDLSEDGDRLAGILEYATDLFDRTTLVRLAERFRRLLAAVTEQPEARLAELSLWTPAERHQVLAEWPAAPEVSSPAPSAPLQRWLAEVARLRPDAIALESESAAATYGELWRRVRRLAGELRARGVGPEVPVAIFLERSVEAIVALFATLEAGGVCLPLDPSYPDSRLALMAADARPRVVVTSRRLTARVGHLFQGPGATAPEILEVAPGAVAPAEPPLPAPEPPVAAPGAGAYVIYTSGSTGRPKGVVVSREAAEERFRHGAAALACSQADRSLLFNTLGFDVAMEEIFTGVAGGAALCLWPAREFSGHDLGRFLRSRRITLCNLPTAAWVQWLYEEAEAGEGELEDLRLAVVGGEAMPAAAARRFHETTASRTRLLNGYGPTEAVVTATLHPVGAGPAGPDGVPIGRPLGGGWAHVAGASLEPLAVGAPGELLLGGAALARGYLGDPRRTAERFVPDAFARGRRGRVGGRLYRTGDLVRWRPDGTLAFLGRIDRQVKLRGFRVEPGEVEAALAEHPAVQDTVVDVRRGAAGDDRLVAYVVPSQGPPVTPLDLKAHLDERLPSFMVPASFVLLQALPLDPNRKVDRRALPAPDPTPVREAEDLGPRTAAEERVAEAFRQVLGLEAVPLERSFFDLGGHSLLASRVVSRLRRELDREVPLRLLFDRPTVRGFAASLEGLRSVGTPPLRRMADEAARSAGLPLSFSQERLWFQEQYDRGSAQYSMPGGLWLLGGLRVPALAGALESIVARHEALRTRFEEEDGEPRQRVAPPAPVPLPVVDLSALPEALRQPAVLELGRREASRPFDLRRPPLLRARLARLGREEHALVVVMHHIVSDGWSFVVLARELAALYEAAVAERAPELPELAVQFPDFAVWQRAAVSAEVRRAELAFWRHHLAGVVPLELPSDRPRPPVRSGRGESLAVVLPEAVERALTVFCRDSGVSPFHVLMAAFQSVLTRWSGQDDFAVGMPVANRERSELEDLVGFFVNTLVLRAQSDPRRGFGEVVRRVREATVDALSHPDLPLELVVEALAPERSADRTPLFQVVLGFLNEPSAFHLPGLRVEPFEVTTGTAKFDLTLNLHPEGEGIVGTLELNADLFDRATGKRLWSHVTTLLAGAFAEPVRPVAELPLLAPAERHQVTAEWTGAASAYPRAAALPELFARQAGLRPDAVAVETGPVAVTYGELARRARRLAEGLRRRGVGPGDAVALLLDRSVEMVVATLAVAEAGAFYAPVDPDYPWERVAFLLEDTAAPVVLAHRHLADRFGGLLHHPPGGPGGAFRGTVLFLDEAADGAKGEPDREPVRESRAPFAVPESAAYVMYTSGSTGRPKGVVVPHRAVARLVLGADFAHLGPEETFLQLAPASFDAATLELWGPLLNGGRLVLAPPGRVDLAQLGRTLAAGRVTTLWLTAGLFQAVVEERLSDLAGVRQLLAGGDVLSPVHVRRVLEGLPGTRVVNGYGPTENTTFTACHAMASTAQVASPVPIGRPIADTSVLLLDARLAPVPAGVPGELYTAGDGLARGYLGRPARTAAAFLPHPSPAAPGERLYRTGDLARWRGDGTLHFLGRRDHQVKIRGFRIELGEVEAALVADPAVETAVVVAREDGPGSKRLVAYVVPAPGVEPAAVAPAALRALVAEHLPGHMVPSVVVPLDRLPLDPNGKVDRRALPEPEVVAAAETETARTPAETVVAEAFAQVLGLERVPLEESFFDLGGHSLLATSLASRVGGAFGVELPLRTLFDRPTVRELAAVLDELRAESPPPLVPLPPGSRAAGLPLSFAQERLWFLEELEGPSARYNVPVLLGLEGALDRPAFAAAMAGVVERHETLRTTFATRDGGPVQVVAPAPAVAVPLVDLGALPAGAARAALRRLAGGEARRPFDLSRGPLLRVVLVRLAASSHTAVVNLHHVVSDGWSMGVFLRDLGELYRARRTGEPAALPELPVQYADFAAWQREWIAGDVLEGQLAYWRKALAGLPVLELPTDRPVPAVRRHAGESVPVVLGPALGTRLRELARRHQATPFMVLLATFQALLSRLSGRDDLAVGTPIANRTRSEVEGLIGFFVNTLVLRAELADDPPVHALIDRTRERALEAYARQDVPFERLVEELAPGRDLAHSPLFQVLFILQTAPFDAVGLPGLELRPDGVATGTAKFDLTLALADAAGGGFAGSLEYDRDLFDPTTARRLARSYGVLAAAVADAPDRRLSRLPLMPRQERQQVLVEWNGGRLPSPVAETLHEGFVAWARRGPEAVALVARGETVSYGELDRRSAALAARLRVSGVGPDVRVGVCLERTPRLVVALLAVLRAGGAYVPLDPAYPRDRIAFMLEDSACRVLLTESGLRERLAAAATAEVLELDRTEVPASGGEAAGAAPAPSAGPRSLAYTIYTSGSTGRPKGVAIEHGSACALLAWARTVFPSRELDGVLASTSVCFDLSVFELFLPLASGGRVLLAADALDLATLPAAGAVTLINTVPSAMTELARMGAVPPSVTTVNLAGEPLRAELVRRVHESAPVERVLNLYGPSEDTTYSTCADVDLADPREAGEPTIGRPVGGTRAVLFDARGEPVPAGVPGELHLGGAGLSRGYLGRPGLTASRYVPDPGGAPGDRLYRTGDLVRQLADGRLAFLGRIDRQVKVRGFRIELGEVESALTADPAVEAAAVLVRGEGSDALPTAFVASSEPVTAEDLRDRLHQRLPAFMVPERVVFLNALPLTPNGKVDRRALAARPLEPVARGAAYAPPRTPVEELLAEAFAEILEVDRVGIHAGFFDLGGHSLKAARLASRLREVLRREVPLRLLFERPTVAGLADAVAALDPGSAVPAPPLVPWPRPDGTAPLSHSQERLWILDRIEPGSSAYGMPMAARLRGAVDLPALRRALGRVVARHESLRTTFTTAGGRPVQRIGSARTPALPVVDLRGLPAARRAPARDRTLAQASARTFDLRNGPLLRALVAWEDEDDRVLHVTTHHIVSDGWSLGVLIDETAACYRAEVEGGPAPLPELPVQYADYARWQRRWLAGDTRRTQLDFWRERLAGAPQGLELPFDRPRPAVRSFVGGQSSARLGRELTAALRRLASGERSTLFMVLLAGFALLLQRLSGEEDVVLGTPVAGRGRREVEGLIGMFLNTLVLRCDLAGDPAFGELVARVREVALGAYAHQDLPFEMLLDELRPERDLSRTPLFQVFFNMIELPLGDRLELPGAVLEPVRMPDAQSKFDLTLYLQPRDGGVSLEAVFDARLFDAATVDRFLAQYAALLEQAAEDPARPISSFALPSAGLEAVLPDPRVRLDRTWHGAVHQALARTAREHPDRVAVSEPDGAWTYAALARECRRVAVWLSAAGVSRGDRVAIYSHRSAALVAAVVGVLEGDGVFVILDPAYPPGRLAEMVEVARPAALLVLEAAGAPPPELLTPLAGLPLLEIASAPSAEVPPTWPSGPAGSMAGAAVGPDDPAYVAFTSGSTGRPKGILGRHGSLTHFLPWQCRRFDLRSDDRFSVLSGLAHDPLHRDLFTPLWLGATAVLPEPEGFGAAGRLALWLDRERVSAALLTPAMAQVVTERSPGSEGVRAGALRRIFLVGDVLTVRGVERLRRLAPRATCVNLYGSTETQRAVAFHELVPVAAGRATGRTGDPSVEAGRQMLPLGRGMEDVQLLVLDRSGGLCAVGEVGEVCVRSPHVALGYLDDPALTARKFVPNPFTGDPDDPVYRTGDLGRYLADGSVAYLGRADDQVKVRGFRIELGEVQAHLAAAPGVREAVVLVEGEGPGGRRLVGYVVPEPDVARPTAAHLRAFLQGRLPAHMVPAGFAVLDAIPLTPNRKVDRRALARIEDSSREVSMSSGPPETEAERTIAGIVREVLELDTMGVEDNFFELGGNSLLLVQVHGRLEAAFERTIPMVALFNHPTVRSLAAHLAPEESGGAAGKEDDERHRLMTDDLKAGRDRLKRRLQRMKA